MSKRNTLEFDRSQPAFLQRLRLEVSGQVNDQQCRADQTARPQRPKRLDADEDDGPTYVMEDTNESLTKAEYEALVRNGADSSVGAIDASNPISSSNSGEAPEKPKSTQNVAAIGATKKRKAARIIGADRLDEDAEVPNGDVQRQSSSAMRAPTDEKAKPVDKKSAPPKKKKAKVNINFGDDDDDGT
ncbi:uncharacterized protein PV09_08215 [Verruconis gallopava]|uniref:DUF4604 domain-containing protein n=1 Tax=Verruconis gallopava TaxID=253628 RepID=A0A0D2AM13_9PEZI|nr:uncharacterized protein PV09_08215 [Verruconis gallopava]KIW00174.1 hypothetical protein PV09_08215 [Verruconis gallopava]